MHAKRSLSSASHKKTARRAAATAPRSKPRLPQSTTLGYGGPYESLNEIVLNNILSPGAKAGTTQDALLFGNMLSSLTSSMRKFSYRQGMQVGRALYGLHDSRKGYELPEESLADLVGFFESIGYRQVTYTTYPDKISISIHNLHGKDVGAKTHSFEAGIMSGFVSAARRTPVYFNESLCSNNGSGFCSFIESDAEQDDAPGIAGSGDAIERYAGSLSESAVSGQDGATMSSDYHALLSMVLSDKDYVGYMAKIAEYVGGNVGSKLFSYYGKNSSGKLYESAAKTIRTLNLGNAVVKSAKPFDMVVRFDGLNSRREFVDLSLAFIGGILSKKQGAMFTTKERNVNGNYVVEIKERGLADAAKPNTAGQRAR
jgi:predicted hydrocarbon binding protein